MKDYESGERSPLLGHRPTSTSSQLAATPPPPASSACASISACLAVVTLIALLFVGTFIGAYLIHQQHTVVISATYDLVHRDVWHANEAIARGAPLASSLVTHAVMFHTRGPECTHFRRCAQLLRDMQLAANTSTGADIPFNFLIGGDGQTYEARGWSRQSAVAEVPAPSSLTIAFMGDFSAHAPTEPMLRQAETLLAVAVQRDRLAADYRAYGVRYLAESHDDGVALFAALAARWSHWDVLINVI